MTTTDDGFSTRLRIVDTLSRCVLGMQEEYGRVESELDKLCLSPKDVNSNNSQVLSATDLPKRFDDLQDLKSLSRDLGFLKDDLDLYIRRQSAEVLPAAYRHGFTSIPNEIIIFILMELFALYEDSFQGSRVIIRDLSLVSPRLRNIVLQFSEVWTYINLDVCDAETLDMFLRRSGDRSLSVRFRYSTATQMNVLHALPSGNRWTYLFADFSSPELRFNLIEKPPNMSFPTIERLFVRADLDSHWVFPDWTFPNVEAVELDDVPLDSHHFGYDSLETFRYISRCTKVGSLGDFLPKLTKLLRPAVWITTLNLEVSFISTADRRNSLFEIELPNVMTFVISNWRLDPESEYHDGDDPMHVDDFVKIVRAIKLPNVQSICVSLAFVGRAFRTKDLLTNAFPRSHVSHTLTHFTFNLRYLAYGREDSRAVVHVDAFLKHFPTLRRLDVDVGDSDVKYGGKSGTNLGAFRYLSCFHINYGGRDRDQLYNLLDFMRQHSAKLKEIDILSLDKFDEERIRKIFPAAKIHLASYRYRVGHIFHSGF